MEIRMFSMKSRRIHVIQSDKKNYVDFLSLNESIKFKNAYKSICVRVRIIKLSS